MPENAYHANLNSKAYIWSSKRYPFDKQKDFQRRLYKVSKLKGVTLFVQKTARVYHNRKSAIYYYVADKSNGYQGWVRPSALIKGFSPYGYQIIKEKWGHQSATFHAKNAKQNVGIWNWRHTKKRANLKKLSWGQLISVSNSYHDASSKTKHLLLCSSDTRREF
ncbi:hypothetical protein [Lentilactobacillus kisonensis]|uniref:hypothetical protein n=1 Tax=Lentilactobacillus kisonensis TaxID=481722 RepID=UPI001FB27B3F|nr:hypothetical protein [Lentilactobacillus kisonensis]